MSLFGNDQYQWRETYFVLFQESDRPSTKRVSDALADDSRFEVIEIRGDGEGRLESLTLVSPDDFSAMDITFVTGDEVSEQVEQLLQDMIRTTLTDEERTKLDDLGKCNARFDIFHFEQMQSGDGGEDEFLDPGGLLIVMETLTELCNGVSIDPQSGSFMG